MEAAELIFPGLGGDHLYLLVEGGIPVNVHRHQVPLIF